MNLNTVVTVLKNFAPLSLAEKWDNVGLLVEPSSGSSTPIERILLTNDLTEEVLEEALQKKSQFILSYHPPIFAPLKQLSQANAKQRILVKAIENRIAIYSPHTAFDSVAGGVNDWIADAILTLGKGSSSPLQPHESLTNTHKVVVFIPEDKADELREELSKVGAGVIGNYKQCSFGLIGEGTFFGNENANPVVGQKGGLEKVKELRMEFVCSKAHLAAVTQTIKRVHPYEEPAWDTYALHPTVSSTVGQGRLVTLNEKVTLNDLISKVKETFGLLHVKVATPNNKPHANIEIKSVALCAGAGATVLSGRPDVFLTGEMRHHEILDATSKGISVILCDHSNTERGFLKVFREKLTTLLEGKVEVVVSEVDQDPLVVV